MGVVVVPMKSQEAKDSTQLSISMMVKNKYTYSICSVKDKKKSE